MAALHPRSVLLLLPLLLSLRHASAALPQRILRRLPPSRPCGAHAIASKKRAVLGGLMSSAVFASVLGPRAAHAAKRRDPVNRPDLLPKSGEMTRLIDVTGMLSKSQEKLVNEMLVTLEKDTGLKLRVLCQTYPETPGLAIQDYWNVDADTVVLVADPELTGNLLNFNVGDNIDLKVPRNFWGRVSGKFGAKVFWEKEGPDSAVVNAISSIDSCVRASEMGVRGACAPGTIKARDSAEEADSVCFFDSASADIFSYLYTCRLARDENDPLV
eukprot:CAMPEP_0114518422 /NCGR_PEP_ID=MMETSP0109-20121206/18438_1 /TAXON_ID=29199 /ORGANISM="Chlorarachnion reptans, Strain CCCM449" /LENGTH=270 /DNA_ID=CAMNT_0001699047 /DNA_START=103 /DNA_END=916 /DNA_ORIENTATION=+